jgi:two-component system, NtrC family, nitrogen regulation response regulator GlnG
MLYCLRLGKKMDTVWVVDDDESIRWVLEKALTREHIDVRVFSNAQDLIAALAHSQPKVIVSDIRMPGMNGIDMLKNLRARFAHIPVIIMTAFSDLESAVSAFQGGAFEYLAKPFDLPAAVELIRRACEQSEVKTTAPTPTLSPEMLGAAPAMQDLFRAIGRLSQSAVTVLITGESGSGKELVALALHKHSARSSQAFIALNTAAIPRDLLESELFGHEKGAFTGAQATRRGRFEQAEGGTLFLDEIGDMPSELQTRLLRVLSDGHYYRVGGQHPIKANVRVIAATHQDLEERVRQGLFREDLFHRLNVIRLRIPPLRERLDDVPLLARHFLSRCSQELGVEAKRFSDSAMGRLMHYHWPGNVRQIENVCRWLTVMAPAQVIEAKDLPPELRVELPQGMVTQLPSVAVNPAVGQVYSSPATAPVAEAASSPIPTLPIQRSVSASDASSFPEAVSMTWDKLLERQVSELVSRQIMIGEAPSESDMMARLSADFERTVIRTALRHTRGRRIEAAQRLGIGRNTITRKIQELEIDE